MHCQEIEQKKKLKMHNYRKYGLVLARQLNDLNKLFSFDQSVKHFLIQSFWEDSNKFFEMTPDQQTTETIPPLFSCLGRLQINLLISQA